MGKARSNSGRSAGDQANALTWSPQTGAERRVTQFFGLAGIQINGKRDWDIQVHDQRFFRRFLADGSLGLGEAYMQGWWDCHRLDECSYRIHLTELPAKLARNYRFMLWVAAAKVLNLQSVARSRRNVTHYSLGNDLFKAMLDENMVYTCGYWRDAASLAEAQKAKLDLICRKMGLQEGMRVLDLGCGWGGFARYAAEAYGVHVVGVNIATRQVELARELCQGLPVEIRQQDYRDVSGSFDRVVAVGVLEHIGPKNHRLFMQVAHRCLNDDGLLLVHTVGNPSTESRGERFGDTYIFRASVSPSLTQIAQGIDGLFVVEDLHNFGTDYDPTLMAWFQAFDDHWSELKAHYDDRFYRMWKFYLLMAAGISRAGFAQVWQMVLAKRGVVGGYQAIR